MIAERKGKIRVQACWTLILEYINAYRRGPVASKTALTPTIAPWSLPCSYPANCHDHIPERIGQFCTCKGLEIENKDVIAICDST